MSKIRGAMRAMRREFLPQLVLLLAAFASVSGCGDPAMPLRIGTNMWIGYEPLYIARDRGWLPQTHLVELQSATQAAQFLQTGVIDVAALTLDETLHLVGRDPRYRVIAVLDRSNGADALLARPQFPSLQSLRGARVGAEQAGVGVLLLERALRSAGMTLAEVRIQWQEQHQLASLMRAGEIDAVATFEPVRSTLLSEGAVQLYSSAQAPDLIVDVLVARDSVVQRRGDALRALTDAWFRAVRTIEEEPAATRRTMAARLHTTPERVSAALELQQFVTLAENRALLAPGGLCAGAAELARSMIAAGLLQPPEPALVCSGAELPGS